MGGVPVPSEVLLYYQTITDQSSPEIRPGETVHFGAMDASAPISVLLWHWVTEVPRR